MLSCHARSRANSVARTGAGNIGSLVMAVTAGGLDPTHFAGRNLLQDLVCTYNPETGAYNTQLFNDAQSFAVKRAEVELRPRQQVELVNQVVRDRALPVQMCALSLEVTERPLG